MPTVRTEWFRSYDTVQVVAPNQWNTPIYITKSYAPLPNAKMLAAAADYRMAYDFLDEPDGLTWFGNEPGHVDVLGGSQWFANPGPTDPPELKTPAASDIILTGALPMTNQYKWVRTDRDVEGISSLWQTTESIRNFTKRDCPSPELTPEVHGGLIAYFSDSIGTEGNAFLMHVACWLRVLWQWVE